MQAYVNYNADESYYFDDMKLKKESAYNLFDINNNINNIITFLSI